MLQPADASIPKVRADGLDPERRCLHAGQHRIVEGHRRAYTKEFLNHSTMARDALAELEAYRTLTQRVGLIAEIDRNNGLTFCDEIRRMPAGSRRSLGDRL